MAFPDPWAECFLAAVASCGRVVGFLLYAGLGAGDVPSGAPTGLCLGDI